MKETRQILFPVACCLLPVACCLVSEEQPHWRRTNRHEWNEHTLYPRLSIERSLS
ncbi:MAG: hypothetical protein F6K31_37940 [Symploca sp. SIO2G7]|nr:hypothetical protein [Symploca sp. SIO2G7]